MIYITIDGGTTNTRVNLVVDNKIVDTLKLNVGARAGIEDKELLKIGLKESIQNMLKKHNLHSIDVSRIIASGMITSEYGLCSLEHINTPAGIKELHDSMFEVKLQDISEIPFVFIRGIKKEGVSFEDTDMMRGEETELIGIMDDINPGIIYILPGSHSKIITTNEENKIVDFSTMLTGEMADAISKGTIIKDAVSLDISDVEDDYLLKGYDYTVSNGINKALFKVRILKNLYGCNKVQLYSFFLGVILCDEIKEIVKKNAETVVVGGKEQIKIAMSIILKNRDTKNIVILDNETVNSSTSSGMIKIFEFK